MAESWLRLGYVELPSRIVCSSSRFALLIVAVLSAIVGVLCGILVARQHVKCCQHASREQERPDQQSRKVTDDREHRDTRSMMTIIREETHGPQKGESLLLPRHCRISLEPA